MTKFKTIKNLKKLNWKTFKIIVSTVYISISSWIEIIVKPPKIVQQQLIEMAAN